MKLFPFRFLKYSLFALLLVFSFASLSQAQNELVFSLDDCIDYAFENNPNMVNAELEIDKQRKVVGETLSIGFPQISGNVDLRNNFEVPTSFIPGEFFGQPGQFFPIEALPPYCGEN